MKFYVYHWMGMELSVPGVYQEGEAPKSYRKPHWIDIPEGQFEAKLMELLQTCDVMLLSPLEKSKYVPETVQHNHYRIFLDCKGGRFKTR